MTWRKWLNSLWDFHEILYQKLSSKLEFHEYLLSDTHTLCKHIINFCVYFPHFLLSLHEILYRSPHNAIVSEIVSFIKIHI